LGLPAGGRIQLMSTLSACNLTCSTIDYAHQNKTKPTQITANAKNYAYCHCSCSSSQLSFLKARKLVDDITMLSMCLSIPFSKYELDDQLS
jgi:uncharacterized protein YdeI (YjbR/CyaY-like superfamily)